MDYDNNSRRFESVFSKKVRAGKRRTYFFDVRQTKGEDYYLTLTESTKKFETDSYERHKLFLYKEDFNRFLSGLTEAIDYVKTELLPDYDYDEFTKRHIEWEAQRAAEDAAAAAAEAAGGSDDTPAVSEESTESDDDDDDDTEDITGDVDVTKDDDMSW